MCPCWPVERCEVKSHFMVECFSHLSDIDAKKWVWKARFNFMLQRRDKKGKSAPFLAVFLGLPPGKLGSAFDPSTYQTGFPKGHVEGLFLHLCGRFCRTDYLWVPFSGHFDYIRVSVVPNQITRNLYTVGILGHENRIPRSLKHIFWYKYCPQRPRMH